MKSKIINFAFLTALSSTLVLGAHSAAAVAQTPATLAPTSRAEARKENHQLEHNVQKALEGAKIDVADIRVVAKHGNIGLDGEVSNANDIETAAAVARKVAGVTSVKNYLSVYEEGAQ
ncbi:BON domain-containing protein [Paraburkholderia unamae]|uniref:BON domain-containing protein n=1 Tax=Paraburkholderia unamae TaxID=219649 RepID=A0ABX5KXP8_9BURK|nr:BON domain-containing protein [Paraburkholderia unamae]PVX85920.1 BON domain-containing protein [Paraburkholderia unamae]